MLTGTNTFSGGTRIAGGAVQVSADAALGAAASPVAFANGTLRAGAAFASARPLAIDPGQVAFVDTNGFAVTLSGPVSGNGGFVKQGAGTLALTNAGNSQGNTRIDGGTLAVSADGQLGAAGGTLFLNGGTLQTTGDTSNLVVNRPLSLQAASSTVQTDRNLEWAGPITESGGARALVKTGDRNLFLTNAGNTWSGGITVTGGALLVGSSGSPGSLGTGPVSLTGGYLAFNQGNPLTVGSKISGSGEVDYQGAQTVVTAANDYTGGTYLFNGTLVVNSSTTTGTSGTGIGLVRVILGSLGGTGRIAGPVTVGTSGVLRGDSGAGTGTLTLDGGARFVRTGNGADPTLAVQLATDAAGAVSGRSYVTLGTAAAKFNVDLSNGGLFRILLQNDAGLVRSVPYALMLATGPAGGQSFQRNGTDLTSGYVFAAADFQVASGSGAWTFQNTILSVTGNTLQLTFTPVPEPATVGLLAAAGLLAVRRLRRPAAAQL